MSDGINSIMYEFGAGKSAIRTVFEETTELRKQGRTDFWDFSIGNPEVPAPPEVNEAIADCIATYSQLDMHGYPPNNGWYETRAKIAEALNRDYDTGAAAESVVMTGGAAGAITATIASLTTPGEEVIVITPYFAEYRMYIQSWHCRCVEVPSVPDTFQIDVDAIERAITPATRMVIVNTPCNPTGTVYKPDSLLALGDMLRRKSAELDRTIYLLSDEPYRQICYDGVVNPWVAGYYENTLVAYSFSKALSIPGERIGYAYVPPTVKNQERVVAAILGGQRACNTITNGLFQRVIERCIDIPAPVDEYARKRRIIHGGLGRIGYQATRPDGAFYLWIRALEPDDHAFCRRATKFGLYLVESTDFGTHGYARLSYAVDDWVLTSSLPAFQRLWEDYGGYTW